MTPERLAEAIAEVNEFASIWPDTFEKCLTREVGLTTVGIAIEVDPDLTEKERNEARRYYFEKNPPLLQISEDAFE